MKRLTAILVLAFLTTTILFASTYEIKGYVFDIKGRTQESALRREIANDEGQILEDLESLEAIVEDKLQALLEKRMFRDVRLWWEQSDSDADPIPVTIHVELKSTISAYASPGGAYDSNHGLRFLFSGVDQNFMGSMKESSILLDFRQRNGTFDDTVFQICAKTGGYLLGSDFQIHFDLFKYSKETEKDNVFLGIQTQGKRIGSSLGIRIHPQKQAFGSSEKQDEEDLLFGKLDLAVTEDFALQMDLRSTLPVRNDSTSSSLKLAGSYSFERLVGFDLAAELSTTQNWKGSVYKGGFETLLVTLGIKDIQWSKDFRSGYVANASFEASDNGRFTWNSTIAHYAKLNSWMNLHTRAIVRIANHKDPKSGSEFTANLRGIRDDNSMLCNGDFRDAVVLNANLFCHALTIDWLGSFYVSPFVDLASFSKKGARFIGGAGCEFFAILNQWPGLPFRLSYGHSLTNKEEWELTVNAHFFF